MQPKQRKTKLVMSVLALAALAAFSPISYAGNLEPNAPPGPTMKTLDEVQPRIPISPGDIPLTINTPGSYYFTGDLTYPSTAAGYAITVEANNVTIDLMGYSLIGPGAGQNYGIWIVGQHNVEVRNGTICNFGGHGLATAAFLDRGHRVVNIRAAFNGKAGYYSGMYVDGNSHLIKDCIAIGNTGYGIFADECSTVTGNTVYDNQTCGIYAEGGSTVTGNLAYNNNAYGIQALHGCTISGNTVHDNNWEGITTQWGCTITGNSAFGNNLSGVFAGSGSTVTGNTACSNARHGIATGKGCTVTGNTAYYNQRHGIDLGTDCLVDRNTANSNNQSSGGYTNISACASCTWGLNEQ